MCYDATEPSVFSAAVVPARKAHACYECRQAIPRGAAHEVSEGCWDGHWSRYRTCLGCVSLRDAVTELEIAEGCGGHESTPAFGELWAAAIESEVVSAWPRKEDEDACR